MATEVTPVSAVLRIPLGLIDPGPNARGDLGDLGDVTELAASLRTIGQQIPVVVEPAGDRWRLLDGHRRHAAARRARLPHLDAVVRPVSDDARRLVAQLAIQAGGRRFNPMAEARALHALMFEHGLTREQIAAMVGRSAPWVRDRIGLIHLEPGEIRAVEAGRMPVGEALLRLRGRREMREGRPSTTERARPRMPRRSPTLTARPRRAEEPRLSERQVEVLRLLAEGLEYGEIGSRCGVTMSTAKSHVLALYDALGAHNAPHAVHLGYQYGLLTVGGDRG